MRDYGWGKFQSRMLLELVSLIFVAEHEFRVRALIAESVFVAERREVCGPPFPCLIMTLNQRHIPPPERERFAALGASFVVVVG